jgi:hypothetical protein
VSLGGCVLAVALVAGACSKPVDTGEISARSGEYGAQLATSTTLDENGLLGRSGGGSRRPATRADVVEKLLEAVAKDPTLASRLGSLTPQELAEITGVSVEELSDLGITPSTVAALGDALVATRGSDAQNGLGTDSGAIFTLLGLTSGFLDGDNEDTMLSADVFALASILAASAVVGTDVTGPLGKLLAVADPNGLGQYSEDHSMLAIVAVLLGYMMGRDSPVPLDRFDKLPPETQQALGGIVYIADRLTPQAMLEINRIVTILGPEAIKAIAAAFGLLDDPRIASAVRRAAEDQVVFGSILASAVFLIPGLAEELNPAQYGTSEQRMLALAGVFIAAMTRMDPEGLETFLGSIGIPIDPEFWESIGIGIPPEFWEGLDR